jgi:antitoxin VapB
MHTPGAINLIPDMHHISTLTRERIMRTVSIFKNGNNRAIRLPRDLDFEGVSELEIVREGDSIILRPVRPTWGRSRSSKKPIRTLWRSVRTCQRRRTINL